MGGVEATPRGAKNSPIASTWRRSSPKLTRSFASEGHSSCFCAPSPDGGGSRARDERAPPLTSALGSRRENPLPLAGEGSRSLPLGFQRGAGGADARAGSAPMGERADGPRQCAPGARRAGERHGAARGGGRGLSRGAEDVRRERVAAQLGGDDWLCFGVEN